MRQRNQRPYSVGEPRECECSNFQSSAPGDVAKLLRSAGAMIKTGR
jgi:hypothetical protein